LHDKPDELDHRILDFTKKLAQDVKGRIHVVHVLDPAPAAATLAAATAPEAAGLGAGQHEDLLEQIAKERRELFLRLLDSESIDTSQARIDRGKPDDTLIACATDLGADLVVLGAVSRSRLRSVFIGHTAERVLDRLPCDLIVVKPQGFRADIAMS
jgi:universal stress protein E